MLNNILINKSNNRGVYETIRDRKHHQAQRNDAGNEKCKNSRDKNDDTEAATEDDVKDEAENNEITNKRNHGLNNEK